MEVSSIPVLLITANVGSVFEDPSRLLNCWIKEFLNKVALVKPHFLALHLQEVGGKTYEKSMEYVQEFIRLLCESDELSEYNRIRIYLDEDFNSAEHFTALGNLYFVHHSLQTVKIWNFLTHEWESADGKNIHTGNIEAIATKEKSKFPQHFFPECKWSRKGFLRTRWELNCTVIDLVNIHLFHDASNLAACEEFPSVYCKTRRRALVHTLERFHRDNKNGIAPYFVFGDFNFRCDTEGVVKKLTEDLTKHRIQNTKNDSTKMHYKNMEGENVLIVGKKEFTHTEHQTKFKESWLQKFDRELEPLRELLVEYPITFAPTYPYEEEPDMPKFYMSTRCPAWCDRILMNPTARELVVDETFSSSDYNIIGENICMGDHKPIYLSVNLKTLQGTNKYCNCHQQLLLNEHANNLYSNFSSFLLNYHKMITSQIIIPDNFNNLYNNEISLDASSLYKYCLYLNRNFIDILIECRNIELKIAKRLNACIENVKLLCKNKSSPGLINNNNKHKILLASNIKRAINSSTTTSTPKTPLDSTKNISNILYNNNSSRSNDKENDFINSSSSSTELDNNQQNNNNFDGKIINIIENDDNEQLDMKDEQDKQQEYRQQLQQKPRISINVTNIDDGTVDDICMCSFYNITDGDTFQENPFIDNTGNLKSELIENDSSETPKICPQCQNIIKFHTNEPPQRRLISKRLMLANNIIVNRVDTQFLNTANLLQHHQFESYTPESAESHSPCPEYAEYSIMDDDDDDCDVNNDIIDIVHTDATTNLNNFIDNDLILKNSQNQLIQNNIDTTTIIQQNKPNISNNIQITEYNDENIISNEKLNDMKNQEIILQNNIINNKQNITTQATAAVPTTTEKRGIVSPIQLKSRLEILQKKSYENFDGNDNNIDENNTIIQNINNKDINLNLNTTTATQTTTTATNDKEINVKENIKNEKFDDKKSCFEKCCAIS